MTDYEINSSTLAIIPLGENISKVYEEIGLPNKKYAEKPRLQRICDSWEHSAGDLWPASDQLQFSDIYGRNANRTRLPGKHCHQSVWPRIQKRKILSVRCIAG